MLGFVLLGPALDVLEIRALPEERFAELEDGLHRLVGSLGLVVQLTRELSEPLLLERQEIGVERRL